jgi:HD-GYP domain-containing protein (c-di-GMP phosphodiesterase class II)
MSANGQTITFSIDRLHPGTTLAGPICEDSDAEVLLLNAGVCVTAEQIEQLRNRGITQFRIEKRFADAILSPRRPASRASQQRRPAAVQAEKKAPEICRRAADASLPVQVSRSIEKLRSVQSERLTQVYSLLDRQGPFNADVLDDISHECIEQLAVDMDFFVKASLEPQMSEAAADHCVRVAQLAVAVGALAGHTQEELRWLAMGCLVSRCRATAMARELSEEPRSLTEVEFAEIKRTPSRVFDMLSKIDFPWTARAVAYQIHERWNGSGYPRGRAGTEINPLARIAAVCDAYVSLSSPRAHRPAYSLYGAVKQILADARSGLFDPNAVRCFLRTISLYPIGSYIRLNNGQIGQVVRTNPDAYDRPTIEIVGETPPRMVVLVDTPELQVVEVIDAEQAAEEILVPQAGQLSSADVNLLLGIGNQNDAS